MKFIHPQDAQSLEQTIKFLIENYIKTGVNTKPVIFHSLNVAFYLLNYNYGLDLAKTAILHDLIEDSAINKRDISIHFGDKIANWVDALSFKTSIKDQEKQYQEMFKRVELSGRETLIIKCADLYSNSFYIRLVNNPEEQKFLINKVNYFLRISKKLIGQEPVWLDLSRQSLFENKRLN